MAAWSMVALFALIYGLANVMLALAWWNLLGYFGAKVTRHWSIRCYGITQLAKYVPGNIFHLASRQAMGMAAGVSAWLLVKSAVWELGSLSLAGAVLAFLALPFVLPWVSIAWATVAFASAVGIIAFGLNYLRGPPAVCAFVWHVTFLAVSGLLFVGLIQLLVDDLSRLHWVALCGAFVLAWLAGLVTPGAPAGVGVRELVLLFLLKGAISEADLVLTVVLGRVVTVAGDFGFFGIATLMGRKASDSVS
jgi:hypothetical protein